MGNGAFNPFELPSFNADEFSASLKASNTVFLYKGHFYDQQDGSGVISRDRELYFDYDSTIEGDRAADWGELCRIISKGDFHSPDSACIGKFNSLNAGEPFCAQVTEAVKKSWDHRKTASPKTS